jgi:hypothetical protein
MNNLLNFALREAHNLDNNMDDETRKEWFALEKKINNLKEKLNIVTKSWETTNYGYMAQDYE